MTAYYDTKRNNMTPAAACAEGSFRCAFSDIVAIVDIVMMSIFVALFSVLSVVLSLRIILVLTVFSVVLSIHKTEQSFKPARSH